MIYEKAPAKINFTLDALYKRNDGFHEVEMVMTTVDLNDRVTVEKREDQRVVVKVDYNFVPENAKNLAFQAAMLMKETYQIPQGVTIVLDKEIPVSAGLGGGSADAAATMRAMNRLFELNLTLDELSTLAEQVGSDVPFCIYSKTAVCTGHGEKVRLLKRPPKAWVVIAKPNVGISTPCVFQELKLNAVQQKASHSAACIEAIESGDYEQICSALSNSLEAISMEMHPDILKLKQNMLNSGADGALMSGSGPTVYSLAKHYKQAQNIYNAVHGCCNEVYLVRLLG
ncbi:MULTISPECIES: 4-(cytidine 5'-diphospho)-2-C-methyl-D-erythritol kinase [Staphylococcus]|uniref:4-(cytidine 5'-diphospho)-2-C-methyl-D-erythritol kinase n=1 Tax=Staphylococcus TaxID=1279 RepID=UPI000D03F1E8|nr:MULTISPECIES: 4-(cytidine 5'-diphospho)-2-C-methyl-D-erythritol kinase [Staphylococcus]MCD8916413.1 4-(cytidine 5'-diphospho)-2-C-methyl-D-erythritol kinase [Staphylococcus simulans]